MVRRQRLSRDESQAQTREALMEAAARLFDERGFAATSIADIAEEAGYTTGALYSNFAHKEDLFLAVLERQVQLDLQALREMLVRQVDVRSRLEVAGKWYATQAGEGRRRTRALAEMALMARRGEGGQDRLRELRKVTREAIASLLREQAADLGITFRLPVPTLATAVLALLEGFALASAIDHEVDTAALIAALQQLLAAAD